MSVVVRSPLTSVRRRLVLLSSDEAHLIAMYRKTPRPVRPTGLRLFEQFAAANFSARLPPVARPLLVAVPLTRPKSARAGSR